MRAGIACLVLALFTSSAWTAGAMVETDRPGCRVTPIPGIDARATAQWSGRCVKGLAEGPGVLRWLVDGKVERSYTGVLHDGAFHRYAKLQRANGEIEFGAYQSANAKGASPTPSPAHEGQMLEGDLRAAIKQHLMCTEVELTLKLSEGMQRIAEGGSADPFAMRDITTACASTYKKMEMAGRALAKGTGADEKAMMAFVKEIHLEAQRAAISATWLAKAALEK
jgi:hypothetical protein